MTIITTGMPGGDFVICRSATGKIEPSFGAGGLMASGPFRLPTDPLGYVAATFDGVHAGSEIRIFSLAGIERTGVESCDDDHVLTWGVYGSPDTVIVRIVNVAYKIKEFNLKVSKGSATIPVQQEPDPWYSNP